MKGKKKKQQANYSERDVPRIPQSGVTGTWDTQDAAHSITSKSGILIIPLFFKNLFFLACLSGTLGDITESPQSNARLVERRSGKIKGRAEETLGNNWAGEFSRNL